MSAPRAIAIVGVAGRFPGASDVETLWRNVLARESAIREVPANRWPVPAKDMVSREASVDHTRSRRAGLLDPFELDASGLNLPADLVAKLSPLAKLTLQVGADSWRSAKLSVDLARVGVVLANIALPTDGASKLAEAALLAPLDTLLDQPPTSFEPLERYPSALPTGLLARALGFGGGTYTLDAACASSLYAIHLACADLEAGRVDAALAGGVCLPQALYTQVGFTQLQALSPSGVCAPFDKRADGLVAGEGAGIFVLRRLDDAVRDGNQIHAVIRGIGLSNDVGGSLLSPEREGQLRSMRAAYAQAGWQPSEVQLIECHGTGTPRGDAVELSSLSTLFGQSSAVIGSVKSNVGHLLTAAGSAALCKVLAALSAKTLPPSANFSKASAAEALTGSSLRVLEAAEPWASVNGHRRAAVSGFGFGGINAHLLLEAYEPGTTPPSVKHGAPAIEIAIVGMATHFGRLDSLTAFQHAIFRGEPVHDERPADRWFGLDGAKAPRGAWLDAFSMPLGRFKIPPREMASILPQQLLMLKVAAEAFDDAQALGAGPHLDAGAVIGLALDLDTTSFHLRWVLRSRMRAYIERKSLAVSETELEQWVSRACESLGPALDSTRTLGALGGIVPSRVAREFQLGGPSFAVSSEESSGLRALEVAVGVLRRGEARVMLAGAVDLAGDVRQVLATNALRPYSKLGVARPFDERADGPTLGEGAAAVVLKRLDDAMRDGDRVYAVIRGIGSAGGSALQTGAPRVASLTRASRAALAESGVEAASVSVHLAHGSGDPAEDHDDATALSQTFSQGTVSAAASVIGHTGAASGLASLIAASLSVFHEVIPPLPGVESSVVGGGLHVAPRAQVWLRNRAEGPRRASVGSLGIDGSAVQEILEGVELWPDAFAAERARPLGSRGFGLFLLAGDEAGLRAFAKAQPAHADIESIAAGWYAQTKARTAVVTHASVASDSADLLAQLERPRRVEPVGGEVAFVFPGSGNHYVGMGLGLALPQVYRALDAEVGFLAAQLMPKWVAPYRATWGADWLAESSAALAAAPERMILGQVAHGIAVSDALRTFGISPRASIGYSLGESAGLFASRAWKARDEMFRRTLESPLFRTQLAGENTVAREAWGSSDWYVVVVNRASSEVRKGLHGTAALLIVNAPNECVIGGRRGDVEQTVTTLECEAVALEGVPTVHLPLVKAVAREYHALHELPTTPPPGVRFYSAAWARSYEPTEQSAADSILGNAIEGFDFQALIERAYADGVRVFIEPGPQGSCTRMISRILAGRPHLAVTADQRGQDAFRCLLTAVARAAEAGVVVNLEALYGADSGISLTTAALPASTQLRLGGKRPPFPAPPRTLKSMPPLSHGEPVEPRTVAPEPLTAGSPAAVMLRLSQATSAAHEAFLKASNHAVLLQAHALGEQQRLLAQLQGAPVIEPSRPAQSIAFDRAQCLEFAVGKLSVMLGPAFTAVDAHPSRVRLPAEPLMLVDRIVSVEGTKGVPGPGRVVTEHDVVAGAWYLDGGRAPVCISVEAGQADLFLSAYLGIDFKTRGERVYRLLDAKITFHRDLPRAGETIRYDIRIDRFIQQGDTWLFFFHFDGTIDGAPFITMYDGCAGFFSAEQLETGRGIVAEQTSTRPARRPNTTAFSTLVQLEKQALSSAQVDALRGGDLVTAFGAAFSGQSLAPALRLPGGRMHLVDRILELDPTGGRFGQGLVHGEADITPDKWFLTCHFIDDPVMPGTLMYECCLHTLRVLLLRMGWVTDDASLDLHYAPIEGQASRLRCRGQVLPTTKKVSYRIELKEVGYDPEPYVLADASMFADGRHVVEMEGMSVRVRGLTREKVESLWRAQHIEPKPAYSKAQILAYAEGNPSEGFGEPYKPFDRERRLARLPRAPFLFLDRVISVDAPPWVLKPGGWVEGAFDVDPKAWFFAANQQPVMPFAVLLEAALQPCGWLAAYVGSALTSSEDLHFRNLDGVATQHLEVTPEAGTLTSRARLTKTSQAGGMILQEFEMQILSRGRLVYGGTTGFGFFPAAALASQVGIRGASLSKSRAGAAGFELPRFAPERPGDVTASLASPGGFALPARAFSMIDRVDVLELDGGPKRLGFVSGSKKVDPAEWFFEAHFYQDPVMPGSLGLEAMLQLMKVFARERFGRLSGTHRFETMALGREHKWQYRGQVVPTNGLVQVQATVTHVDDQLIVADGLLSVDGRVIYSMTNFSLRLVADEAHP